VRPSVSLISSVVLAVNLTSQKSCQAYKPNLTPALILFKPNLNLLNPTAVVIVKLLAVVLAHDSETLW